MSESAYEENASKKERIAQEQEEEKCEKCENVFFTHSMYGMGHVWHVGGGGVELNSGCAVYLEAKPSYIPIQNTETDMYNFFALYIVIGWR
jgi:hypothetical protein